MSTVLWEKCIKYEDKWAGVKVSFTACCSIKEKDGRYFLGVQFSKWFDKDFELAPKCFEDSFGIGIVTVKFRTCLENLAITNNSISGKAVLDLKLCASLIGCSTSKKVGEYAFDIRFLSPQVAAAAEFPANAFPATSAGYIALDATDYEPITTSLITPDTGN